MQEEEHPFVTHKQIYKDVKKGDRPAWLRKIL